MPSPRGKLLTTFNRALCEAAGGNRAVALRLMHAIGGLIEATYSVCAPSNTVGYFNSGSSSERNLCVSP
jgi:hypothetical protein